MTATHARTPNEQRIAALEVEVVTMREAMEEAVKDGSGRSGGSVYMIHREQWLALRSALATTTDYANKCVVNTRFIESIRSDLITARASCQSVHDDLDKSERSETVSMARLTNRASLMLLDSILARLDSLRKGGGE